MLSIEDFRQVNNAKHIVITQHSRKRMTERDISLSDVMNAIENGKIIEQYPDDFPFPSGLILGRAKNFRPLHIVASVNEDMIYLITAYFPDSSKWDADGITRKDG